MGDNQNSGQNTGSQQQQTGQSNRDSQQPVTVYVPVQGQGPDYVSKGAGAGKS